MDNVHPHEGQLARKFSDTSQLPWSVRRPLRNEQRRKPLPSQAESQERFLLDVNTGKLINRKTCGKAKAGSGAGCLCHSGRCSPYRRVTINRERYHAHNIVSALRMSPRPPPSGCSQWSRFTAGDTGELQGNFRTTDGYFAANQTSFWGAKIG
jgi:hypothetical protein